MNRGLGIRVVLLDAMIARPNPSSGTGPRHDIYRYIPAMRRDKADCMRCGFRKCAQHCITNVESQILVSLTHLDTPLEPNASNALVRYGFAGLR